MTRFELLEAKVETALKRIAVLEAAQVAHRTGSGDELAAQQLAQALGFAAAVLTVPARQASRRKLAQSLRQQGWSAARIARVFRVCERTAERWLQGEEDGGSRMEDRKP